MSAPTVVKEIHQRIAIGGNVVKTYTQVKGSAAYTTGGDSINAVDFGLSWILSIKATCISGDRKICPVFASAEPVKSVKFLETDNAGTEIVNGTDESGKIFIVEAEGTY